MCRTTSETAGSPPAASRSIRPWQSGQSPTCSDSLACRSSGSSPWISPWRSTVLGHSCLVPAWVDITTTRERVFGSAAGSSPRLGLGLESLDLLPEAGQHPALGHVHGPGGHLQFAADLLGGPALHRGPPERLP